MLAIANDRMKAYQTEMQQPEASEQLLYLVFFLKRKRNQYKKHIIQLIKSGRILPTNN